MFDKSKSSRSQLYSVNPGIQSEYWKIRTRKNSVFGHFSRSARFEKIFHDTAYVNSESVPSGKFVSQSQTNPIGNLGIYWVLSFKKVTPYNDIDFRALL